jgi:hypothetical protein
MDYDGENYVCRQESFTIPAYRGEKEISSLPVFPLRYAENAEQILRDARALGRNFVEYQDNKLMTHNGWGLDLDVEEDAPLHFITGDVVVDMAEAIRTNSGCMQPWKFPKYSPNSQTLGVYHFWEWKVAENVFGIGPAKETHYWLNQYTRLQKIEYCTKTDPFLSEFYNDREKQYQLQDRDFELLPRRLFAYALSDRKFRAVDVRNMEPVGGYGETNAPSLIINPNHERMLRALIEAHFRRKDLHENHGVFSNQDIISNKGRGLVILLYGVPGVGKTSTAEKIAHSWKRPLLPITCGDLGTNPVEVESRLKDLFRLAQKWDCILLMDEADVFLSERNPTALERNALVSVFLRQIEYYSGIMFLTTNLPGSIDEAFKSRIHISLYYPHLNEETAMAIWKVNLRRLQATASKCSEELKEPPLTIDVRGIKKFAKQHFRSNEDGKGRWNGRQIRNAFLIASALAQFEKDNPHAIPVTAGSGLEESSFDLKPRHFKVVADASRGFERYLAETRGRTASEMMFQRGQRADFILSSPEQAAELSSGTAPNTHIQGEKELFTPPGPVRGPQGWGGRPLHNQQSYGNLSEPQLPYQNPSYGGYQGYTLQTHQDRLFDSSQQDPGARLNPNFGGTLQSHRHAGFQGSPSPSRQSLPAMVSGENIDADADSDSDV